MPLVGDATTDAPITRYNASFSRIRMVEPRGSGPAWLHRLITQPQMKLLIQDMRGKRSVPGGVLPVTVNALLESGSDATSISEALARRLQQEVRQMFTELYRGSMRVQRYSREVRAMKHQTIPLHLAMMTPWGYVRFQLPFVILSGLHNKFDCRTKVL